MIRVVVIGAGGHGCVVAEILRHQIGAGADFQLWGFIDENDRLHGSTVGDLPVLGNWAWFEGGDRRDVAVICAVGSPRVNRQLVQRAIALDLPFVSAISPRAHVSPRARLGRGVVVFPQTVISTGVILDDYCIVNAGATVSHDTHIGSYSNINPGVHLAGNVTVDSECYIGMGATVIQGLTIGAGTVVGAGAVVIGDLPAHVTAVGVPARIITHHKEEAGHAA
jgi:sugar O-acyltransferase (sialic acid O-acetyltransferase NeuD family)